MQSPEKRWREKRLRACRPWRMVAGSTARWSARRRIGGRRNNINRRNERPELIIFIARQIQ
jgi:hypothetical protein